MVDIERSFPKHPLPKPSEATVVCAAEVREHFRSLAARLDAVLPNSREKALALTHLEDASTYAVKAIYADSVVLGMEAG